MIIPERVRPYHPSPLLGTPIANSHHHPTGQAENFAQNVNVALYDKVNPLTGGIWGQPYSVWKIQNQFQAVETQLGNQLLPGGTCSRGIYSGVTVSR